MTYTDENGNKVKARNYQEAAEKLYGQGRSYKNSCYTTVARIRRDADGNGWADVSVWKPGDKIGSFYGAQAATPTKHILHRSAKGF